MFVVPDDYDGAYAANPHLDRLQSRGPVRVYGTPPRDEAELLARLVPARVLIPIRERTPITAARLAALPDLRLISMTGTGVASLARARGSGFHFSTCSPRSGSTHPQCREVKA